MEKKFIVLHSISSQILIGKSKALGRTTILLVIKRFLLWLSRCYLSSIDWIRKVPPWKISCVFSVSLRFSILVFKTNDRTFSLIWSVVLACHGAASSFASLLILRILLGIFESLISPGFSLLTSIWYKPSEHVTRHTIWFLGNSVGGVLGGFLSYGIGHIKSGIAPWRVSWLPLWSPFNL